jgi:hypothetical protein
MKTCFKCGQSKPAAFFYPHLQMGDGHLGKCKVCTRKDAAERIARKKLDPLWVNRERARCRTKQERYRLEGRAKQPSMEAMQRWNRQNRPKKRAELIAYRAHKKGILVKPAACQHCGRKLPLEKHHPDYSKPLVVEWLCSKCHGITRRKS